ncbi:hypothetical protein [Tenacibaculum crassostreae]|uniref:hypothetical protein n=1 Tax=Tenacibaculum crassostreae TaxID=502683 RepID=UPI0038952F05
MNLLDAPLLFQILTAILSCIVFIKKRTFFLGLLSLFLVVTFVVELTGAYLSSIGGHNFLVYHLYLFFENTLIFLLYYKLIYDKKYLIISYFLLAVIFVLWCLIFFSQKYFRSTIIVGAFNVGMLVFLYLRELLLSEKIINYKKILPFWVSVGFLIFYLSTIPFFSFWNYMRDRELFPILDFLIILMNLIISFGLIWSNKGEESY